MIFVTNAIARNPIFLSVSDSEGNIKRTDGCGSINVVVNESAVRDFKRILRWIDNSPSTYMETFNTVSV